MIRTYRYLIGFFLIVCLVLILHYSAWGTKEGFDLNSDRSAFLDKQNTQYNSLGISLISARNEGSLGTDTGSLTGTVVDGTLVDNYKLTGSKTGLFKIIEQCEAIKTADCSIFDTADFKKNCAVCLSPGGKNSEGVQSIGGRVLLESDRVYTDSQPTPRNALVPPYQATVGTCPAGKLVSTKEQCLALQKQLACENGANYGLPGCSQCFSDSTYSIVDKEVKGLVTGTGTLNLVGEGALFFVGDRNDIRLYTLSIDKILQIVLPSSEMTPFYLYIFNASKDPISIGGYLSGPTVNGTFNIDLYRVIPIELINQRKPYISKKRTVNGVDVSIMAPIAVSANENIFNLMVLIGTSPFSFVDTSTPSAAMCPSSPFITTQAGAEYLGSDPCYAKGSGPGTYKMECLQNLFLSNGCLQSGTGYPTTAAKSGSLMMNADGNPRSLDDIASYIYSQAILTATGLVNGANVETDVWNSASMFCTGNTVSSPCDTSTKTSGPLTKECLNYLWLNKGASTPLGATYSAWSNATSLFSTGTNPQYCTPAGTLSPVKSNGRANMQAINFWKTKGGVASVKTQMNALHQNANTQGTMSDSDRSRYMTQCYGPTVLAPLATVSTTSCPYPTGSDSRGMCGPPVEVYATVRQHCDATSGWARNISGAGTFQSGAGFPRDTSYIVVPAGVKAVLTNRQGVIETVLGPRDFNFCSRGGFNDNVMRIDLSAIE